MFPSHVARCSGWGTPDLRPTSASEQLASVCQVCQLTGIRLSYPRYKKQYLMDSLSFNYMRSLESDVSSHVVFVLVL